MPKKLFQLKFVKAKVKKYFDTSNIKHFVQNISDTFYCHRMYFFPSN